MARKTVPEPLYETLTGLSPVGAARGAGACWERPDSNPQELLTRKQVEAEYGLSVKALERYAWAGGGPLFVKLGHRTVRYRRGDIEAFITAHLVGD